MTNKEKLEALKAFLRENKVEFIENYASSFGLTMDLKLPSLMIAVFVSNGDKIREHEIYETTVDGCKMYWHYKPFFIRESETVDFVIEKMRNCIYDRLVWMQKKFERQNMEKL